MPVFARSFLSLPRQAPWRKPSADLPRGRAMCVRDSCGRGRRSHPPRPAPEPAWSGWTACPQDLPDAAPCDGGAGAPGTCPDSSSTGLWVSETLPVCLTGNDFGCLITGLWGQSGCSVSPNKISSFRTQVSCLLGLGESWPPPTTRPVGTAARSAGPDPGPPPGCHPSDSAEGSEKHSDPFANSAKRSPFRMEQERSCLRNASHVLCLNPHNVKTENNLWFGPTQTVPPKPC